VDAREVGEVMEVVAGVLVTVVDGE
jgi:hypothetical protein